MPCWCCKEAWRKGGTVLDAFRVNERQIDRGPSKSKDYREEYKIDQTCLFYFFFDHSHQKIDILRTDERGIWKKQTRTFLSFRAQELRTLKVTNWPLICTYNICLPTHSLTLLWLSLLLFPMSLHSHSSLPWAGTCILASIMTPCQWQALLPAPWQWFLSGCHFDFQQQSLLYLAVPACTQSAYPHNMHVVASTGGSLLQHGGLIQNNSAFKSH